MTVISTFPTIRNVLYTGDNIQSFKAGDTIKAGMVLCFAASGESFTVIPSIAGAGTAPIGVALYDAVSGGYLAVAMDGCMVYVARPDITGGVACDAGDYAIPDAAAVGGCCSGVAPGALATSPVGRWMEDVAATTATGRILIQCSAGRGGT